MATATVYRARGALAKVPEVIALFWLVKVLTTGMGEAASDFLAKTNLILAGVVAVGGLALALFLQIRTDAYSAARYWFAVSMVAVFGTIAADALGPAGVGLPLAVTTGAYLVIVLGVLAVWYRSEGTLSVHSITTRRREIFYWLTVLCTFALGTAAGDLTAIALHWGYLPSAILFGVAILVPWALHRFGLLNGVAAFWVAYILTRPLGASIADWLGKDKGTNLGLGDGTVTLGALVIIVMLVAYLARTKRDVQAPVIH
jgi:uncharacterized membrane-anchored protein